MGQVSGAINLAILIGKYVLESHKNVDTDFTILEGQITYPLILVFVLVGVLRESNTATTWYNSPPLNIAHENIFLTVYGVGPLYVALCRVLGGQVSYPPTPQLIMLWATLWLPYQSSQPWGWLSSQSPVSSHHSVYPMKS